MRVPTGSSAVTLTSPSSVCGISSKPIVGRISTAATTSAVPTPMTVGRCTRARVDEAAVGVVHAVRGRVSLAVKSRPPRPVRSSTGGGSFSSREHSTGTIVTATNSDIVSENMTTIESCLKRMLETPVRKRSGTNTAMCVSVDARIADQTSSLPSMAACMRSLPCSMCRKVFSSTTIDGVDDHADAERQPAERHRVQRVAGEVEQRERADDRNRDRRADDDRRAEVAQEQEDDER